MFGSFEGNMALVICSVCFVVRLFFVRGFGRTKKKIAAQKHREISQLKVSFVCRKH